MSADDTVTRFRVLSLGAGVQSSVLALLLSQEDPRLNELGYPKPDVAVFADTGWEPDYVYRHLDWLESKLSFPLERVSAGNIRDNLRRGRTVSGHAFVDVPFFTVGSDGKKGILRRQCTNHYKINPIHKHIRVMAGGRPGRPFPKDRRVDMWLGISTDEALRMKPSRESWVDHDWPLIRLGMSRSDCLQWFTEHYPDRQLPRSACVICPYRSDAHWREMRDSEPESFADAVAFDRWLRRSSRNPVRKVLSGRPYLHSSTRPLASAIAALEAGTGTGVNYFNEECEGHCGV